MIALRAAMLLAASLGVLAALGAVGGGGELQPSALRVMVAAVVGLLALLLWPGRAATPARSALRVLAWSAAAAGLAALLVAVLADPPQPVARVLATCAMLMLMLLPAHGLAAWLQAWLQARQEASAPDRTAAAHAARELAGRMVVGALALLGALPLWLGPAAERLSERQPWLVDAVLGLSPLAHLAVASGNDLLRNQWFYQHANLAALPFDYPGLSALLPGYALAAALAAWLVLAAPSGRRAPAAAPSIIP